MYRKRPRNLLYTFTYLFMEQHLRSYVIDTQQRLERGRHDAVSPILTSDISLNKITKYKFSSMDYEDKAEKNFF